MTDNDIVSLEVTVNAARLILRRPPLNFLNVNMLRLIEEAIDSMGASPPCRALIFDSEGPAFCAGLEASEQTRESVFLLLEQFHRVISAVNSFPRPTIALVRGMAVAAGLELVACCDFALASEKGLFGHPETKVGSIPSLAHLLLPPLVGVRKASEMILNGSLVAAREAERIGLIHRVLPDGQLTSVSEEMARSFSTLSTPVLELALHNVRLTRVQAIAQNLREAESLYLDQLMELQDQAEGVRAFLEKRLPHWKNQ